MKYEASIYKICMAITCALTMCMSSANAFAPNLEVEQSHESRQTDLDRQEDARRESEDGGASVYQDDNGNYHYYDDGNTLA